ncbi:MAG: uroporphyrinogen-III synthase [Paludibacteraceae bacterium]|nr:uroporphyrinogen-III synthase [Paludibacteraceae bacterium]
MATIQKILVSQPQPATERNPYSELQKQGLELHFRQLIHVEGLTAKEFRQQRINPLDYTAVLFNSRLGIDHFFRLCEEMRLTVPDSMHYYCISETVANYLIKYIQYRKRKVFFGNNRFEDLLPAMHRRPQEKYMMVMSDVHNDETIRMFASHNIAVQPAVMYRTVASEWPKEQPFDFDMIVLFTPAGVHSLRKNFPDFQQGDKILACFGANTVQAAEAEGWQVAIKAPQPGLPSITAAIQQYLKDNSPA